MEPLPGFPGQALLALRRKKPGGEIPANHSILKLNRKSVQELSPPLKEGSPGRWVIEGPAGVVNIQHKIKSLQKNFWTKSEWPNYQHFIKARSPFARD
jgi:hypothetical protein